MLLIYNKKEAKFLSLNWKFYTLIFCVLGITIISFYDLGRKSQIIHYTPLETKIILNKLNDSLDFSPERFKRELKRINIKYPHIVYAQALLETGYFKSNIFLENHNLFGMRQARVRVNTAKGTYNGHAYYNSWRESILDYAFYQCRYLSQINNDGEYFQYLKERYAEDPLYVNKLKSIIEKENLKTKF